MKKYVYLQDFKDKNKGDIVEMQSGFWSRYYTNKGIIQPAKQLEIQEPIKPKKASRKKKDFKA